MGKPIRLANSSHRRSSKASKNTLSLPRREDLSTKASSMSNRFGSGSPFYSSNSNRHSVRLPAAFSPAKSPCSAKLRRMDRFSSQLAQEELNRTTRFSSSRNNELNMGLDL